MKTRDLELAERLACVLADDLQARLPDAFSVPVEQIHAVTWPLAVRLVQLQRKAKRNKKHAKAYRRVRREVRAYFAAAEVQAPEVAEPRRLVPFRPGEWTVALVPGSTVTERSWQEAA